MNGIPIAITEDLEPLMRVIREHGYVVSEGFEYEGFGDYWARVVGPVHRFKIVRERRYYSVEEADYEAGAHGFQCAFTSKAEFFDTLIRWINTCKK